MGIYQCSSKKLALKDIIELSLQNKNTPVDRKILQEYQFLKEMNKKGIFSSHILDKDLLTAGCNKKTNFKQKFDRFKKWHFMAYPEVEKLQNQTPKIAFKTVMNNKNDDNISFSSEKIGHGKLISGQIYGKSGTTSTTPQNTTPQNKSNTHSSNSSSAHDSSDNRFQNFKGKDTENSLFKFYQFNNQKFRERVAKGPPKSFRWLAWIICSTLHIERSEEKYLNIQKLDLDQKEELQIVKDLNRTISEQSSFNIPEIQELLFRVLKGFALTDPAVSYCQGMNFIVGFLLIISDFNEVDTYYFLLKLFSSSYDIRGFYIDGFPLLNYFNFAFNIIFAKFLPKLKEHFENLIIPDEAWIGKWFQTLYTICLPLNLVTRLWDCIISEGLEFMFNFSLALLQNFEDELLKMEDSVDVLEFFKKHMTLFGENDDKFFYNEEEIILQAKKIHISKSWLSQIKMEFEKRNEKDYLHSFRISYFMLMPNLTKSNSQNSEDKKNDLNLIKKDSIDSKLSKMKICDSSNLSEYLIENDKHDFKRSIISYESSINKCEFWQNNNEVFTKGNNLSRISRITEDEMNISLCSDFEGANIEEKVNTHTLPVERRNSILSIFSKNETVNNVNNNPKNIIKANNQMLSNTGNSVQETKK